MERRNLTRYAWLSIGAAIITIGLKFTAYRLTGSIGLFSDAMESMVNLAAAVFALIMLTIAARPPDESHPFGHSKAEYFAGGLEGALIVLAAISIGYVAVERIINPRDLEQMGIGLMLCFAASLVNLVVALILLKAGKKHNSITLEAGAKHLLTDVWTSAGVIAGVGAVAVTGWRILDPLVAIGVAVNIVWSGYYLIQRSVLGLMDSALPKEERDLVETALEKFKSKGICYHALRTRQAGAQRFVTLHVTVPDEWTVKKGHEQMEEIEKAIHTLFDHVEVFTHLEPNNDDLPCRE